LAAQRICRYVPVVIPNPVGGNFAG